MKNETILRPALIEREGQEIEVMCEFTIYSWGSPARTYGPPEDCDPGDPIEAAITDCFLADGGKDAPRITLTEAERDHIEDRFYEDPPEKDPPEPDYGDD